MTTIVLAPRETVFEYMSDIDKLPEWATEFARELKREGADYKVVNGLGEFYFEIKADSATGVIDMFAGPTKIRWRSSQRASWRCPTAAPRSALRCSRGQACPTTRSSPTRVAQARVHPHRDRVRRQTVIPASERKKMLAVRNPAGPTLAAAGLICADDIARAALLIATQNRGSRESNGTSTRSQAPNQRGSNGERRDFDGGCRSHGDCGSMRHALSCCPATGHRLAPANLTER